MITRIDPPIPLNSPKGPCLAHFLIDNGIENDILWVCFQDNTGECWTWSNKDIRAQKNITAGREYISPFYNPDDVKFKTKCDENDHMWTWMPKDHRACMRCGIYE